MGPSGIVHGCSDVARKLVERPSADVQDVALVSGEVEVPSVFP